MVKYKGEVIQVESDHYVVGGNSVVRVDDVYVVRDHIGVMYSFRDLHSALLFARRL